jgi:hypothetical protein
MVMFPRVPVLVCLAIISCLLARPAGAQLTEATLKGVLVDASGSAVGAASVVAKNEYTGQSRTATTDGNGEFALAGLSPGVYTVRVGAPGFKSFTQRDLKLNVGLATELKIQLQVGEVQEKVEVTAEEARVPVATDGRLSDTLDQKEITDLPVAQRDVFGLTRLSAGATAIPGAANSTKLTNSPVVTVNGNRYRGNNYVLDGSMDTNPNNTGEPAIVPSLESIEEVQVQTGNFSGEFGRGSGSVVNIRTKSGTNDFHGKAWEYLRNSAANARNFFATRATPLVFNQFGANFGGPILKDKTFFFGSYEGTRNANGQALVFQVETPEFRDYVFQNFPNGVAAQLLRKYPAPTPLPSTNGTDKYLNQVNLPSPNTNIPALGTTSTVVHDYTGFDQYLTRVDHSFHDGKDKITVRWISESQHDNGGYSSNRNTLGQAMRGFLGPYQGGFGNLNLGYVHVFNRVVNDARFSFQSIKVNLGNPDAVVPQILITGVNAPFGDIFVANTRLRTYEARDTASLERGRHLTRFGFEFRKIFKGLALGPPSAGSYNFNSISDFAQDKPLRQTLTVDPSSGEPLGFPRYFTLREHGFFVQDDWKVTSRFTANLGLRHDYFGTVSEKNSLLSSVIFGSGSTFSERLASASIGHVKQLYDPQKLNFSPRLGFAYDPFGDGKTSVRSGFSLAFQPHHGQSISGARALAPDAAQVFLAPSQGIGHQILYGIPVPFNPDFALGFNANGGVGGVNGQPLIPTTGFVVNPTIKTQYSESWFLNIQHEVAQGWIVEIGYVGTNGVNLERIDDVNRVAGDMLDPAHFGKALRVNPNFGPVLFVTNGVNSTYHAFTAEVRRTLGRSLTLQANYRWSKWLDTASDTSTGQFLDNDEPGKGAENIACLRCERGRSMFDIPHRFTVSANWAPKVSFNGGLLSALARGWNVSTLINAQSGRPFSVWNGAAANLKCVDTNGVALPVQAGGICNSNATLTNLGGDYNLDGGGGAVGGGVYDRPNVPVAGTIKTSFSQQDFLNGLFSASAFPVPALGTNGNLGRNTFRGPHQITADIALMRSFAVREQKQLHFRLEAFNALNKVNLYLPNTDLSVKNFGTVSQAFDARILQASFRFTF